VNARLTLTDIAARIRTELNDATIHVGTSYDRDYMTAFTKTYPAVWVAAQRLTPIDTGRGYSGLYRQHALDAHECERTRCPRVVAGRTAEPDAVHGQHHLRCHHHLPEDRTMSNKSNKDPSLLIPTPTAGGCYTLVDGKLVRDEDLAKPTPPESTPQEVPAKTVVKK